MMLILLEFLIAFWGAVYLVITSYEFPLFRRHHWYELFYKVRVRYPGEVLASLLWLSLTLRSKDPIVRRCRSSNSRSAKKKSHHYHMILQYTELFSIEFPRVSGSPSDYWYGERQHLLNRKQRRNLQPITTGTCSAISQSKLESTAALNLC